MSERICWRIYKLVCKSNRTKDQVPLSCFKDSEISTSHNWFHALPTLSISSFHSYSVISLPFVTNMELWWCVEMHTSPISLTKSQESIKFTVPPTFQLFPFSHCKTTPSSMDSNSRQIAKESIFCSPVEELSLSIPRTVSRVGCCMLVMQCARRKDWSQACSNRLSVVILFRKLWVGKQQLKTRICNSAKKW